MARPAADWRSSGIDAADQAPVGGEVDVDHFLPGLGLDMGERRHGAEHAGIADQHVDLAVALVEAGAELVDGVEVAQVHRHQQRGLAVDGADLVVQLFERADGAGGEDEVGAFPGVAQGDRAADAAAGSGHKADAAGSA